MEKPESEAVDQVTSVLEDQREMEIALRELKERANSLVAALVKTRTESRLHIFIGYIQR